MSPTGTSPAVGGAGWTPTTPAGPANPRARARAYVLDLIGRYRAGLQNPRLGRTAVSFYHGRLRALTEELAHLQAAGAEGERRARLWCVVAGC